MPTRTVFAAVVLCAALGTGCDGQPAAADAESFDARPPDAGATVGDLGPTRLDTWISLLPDSGRPDSLAPFAGTCALALSCSTKADCTKIGLLECKNGQCVGCVTDADCPFGCDTAKGFCRMCQQDADCVIAGIVIGTGKCDPAVHPLRQRR